MEVLSLFILTLITLIIPQFRKNFFSVEPVIKKKKITERIPFFDFIKGIAIIAVILIHVSYFYDFYFTKGDDLFFVYLMNNIARFAIPLFFICSGILLTSIKKGQILDFYLKKFIRIFVPYLLLTCILSLYNKETISTLLYNMISGQALLPYYFIIILFQLYLIYPVVLHFKDEKNFLLAAFFISLICYLIPDFWNFWGIPFMGKYFFFFAYGIYKRECFLNFKANKKQLYYWLIVILIYLLIIGLKPEIFYNIRLFYGPAVFYLLFYFKNKITIARKLLKLVSSFGINSLWIYLIHFPIVNFFYLFFDKYNINFFLNYALIFLTSLLISYFLAYAFQNIYNYLIINIFNFKKYKTYA